MNSDHHAHEERTNLQFTVIEGGYIAPHPESPVFKGTIIIDSVGKIVSVKATPFVITDVPAGSNIYHIDATDLHVIPGGVDFHTHFQYPQGKHQVVSSDSFMSGSVAALKGGTTTIVDFVEPSPGESMASALEKRINEANDGEIRTDYSFHMTLNSTIPGRLDEIPLIVNKGIPTFKIYTAYDGIRLEKEEIPKAFRALKESGAFPIIHAEDHHSIMQNLAVAQKEDRRTPDNLPSTRPPQNEVLAIDMVSAAAREADLPIHIVHVSCEESAAAVVAAAQAGTRITGEACVHHLECTDDLLDPETHPETCWDAICAPPLRKKKDNAALWRSLETPMHPICCVTSDHCIFTHNQRRGQRIRPEFLTLSCGTVLHANNVGDKRCVWNENPAFWETPGGVGTLHERVVATYSHFLRLGCNVETATDNDVDAANSPEFSNVTTVPENMGWLRHVTRLVATHPASLMGMQTKGVIAPGFDGDITILDPTMKTVISSGSSPHNTDVSVLDGRTFTGSVRHVLLRGRVVVMDGQFVGKPNYNGSFVRRSVTGIQNV